MMLRTGADCTVSWGTISKPAAHRTPIRSNSCLFKMYSSFSNECHFTYPFGYRILSHTFSEVLEAVLIYAQMRCLSIRMVMDFEEIENGKLCVTGKPGYSQSETRSNINGANFNPSGQTKPTKVCAVWRQLQAKAITVLLFTLAFLLLPSTVPLWRR